MKKNAETNENVNSNINKKAKKSHKIIILVFIVLILVTVIGSGAFFGYRVYLNGGGEFNFKGVLATIVGHDEQTLKKLPKVYCLVTGQSQNLTDTIMVCSYDPKKQEASILSIPRDTFVGRSKNTADSYDKINALYQISPQKTLDAVNQITGLDIKYYLNIDTKALRQVVDSIGGVDFDVPIDMDYDDCTQDLSIHLKAGFQHLNGEKAEQVVRFRHNNDGTSYPMEYGDNDLGRMKTQRAFIEAVVKKMATPATLTKLPELIKVAEANVTTNIDVSIAKDYAPYAVDFKTENLKTATLPGTPQMYNSLWFFSQDKEETKTIVDELFGSEEELEEDDEENEDLKTEKKIEDNKKTSSISDSSLKNNSDNKLKKSQEEITSNSKIKIEILNGTSDTKKLELIKEELKEKGYSVVKIGTTSNTLKTTIINRTGKSNAVINDIKENLNNLGIISSGSDNSGVDITVIIGNDYK